MRGAARERGEVLDGEKEREREIVALLGIHYLIYILINRRSVRVDFIRLFFFQINNILSRVYIP